ncbi:MAG: NUDIX hydrolase [Zavarzinella sp.]
MARELIHQGRKIQVYLDQETNDDGVSFTRDLILHPGAVVILPIIDADHICLLKNYRFAVADTLWEVPAGTLEPAEKLQVCAERELAEETGYRAASWHYHGFFYASPGVLNEKLHLFFAWDLEQGIARPEVDEQLTPHVVRRVDALQMVADGTICDAKTVTALLLWEHVYRQKLLTKLSSLPS